MDEVDFAKKLLDWAEKGFSDLGDTMAFGIGATVGSVGVGVGSVSHSI